MFNSQQPKTSSKPKAKKEEKVHIEIDGRFDRPSRGRGRGGERGGRGEGRGAGRGGGGGRGRGGGHYQGSNGHANQAVNVDDESAFPSLS